MLLLLHGFPSASHQFRRLIDSLGRHYRLIAPDYPGFGHTRTPEDFTYPFERLADVIEGFHRNSSRAGSGAVMYLVRLRCPRSASARRRATPSVSFGLVVQNGNAYRGSVGCGLATSSRSRPALLAPSPRSSTCSPWPPRALQYEGRAPPIRRSSPPRGGCRISTSWISPAASRPTVRSRLRRREHPRRSIPPRQAWLRRAPPAHADHLGNRRPVLHRARSPRLPELTCPKRNCTSSGSRPLRPGGPSARDRAGRIAHFIERNPARSVASRTLPQQLGSSAGMVVVRIGTSARGGHRLRDHAIADAAPPIE
ncbi:alpha/beta hydrolase [Streptomyces thinghirensis]|nr:alpha/beta hydrolase [Streptomyces thinghirensis]